MSIYELSGAIEFGLIFGIMAIGVFLSFRVLDFPDLTVDGSFPLGAGIAAACILLGINPWLATFIALLGGFIAGMMTGLISTKMKILNLLASIIVMTALYSMNLHVMKGPNISLIGHETIFESFSRIFSVSAGVGLNLLVYGLLVLMVLTLLHLFFKTNLGLSIRATGDNPIFSRSIGINTDSMIIWGIAVSNAFVALSGALYAQSQLTADVGMGLGTIVSGLAAVIIGECVLASRSILIRSSLVILGSVFYRMVISFAMNMSSGHQWWSLSVNDLNLITAMTVLVFIGITHWRSGLLQKS